MKTTVDLDKPTPYSENLRGFARLRRTASHRFYLNAIRREVNDRPFRLLDIGTGPGSFLHAVQASFPNAQLSGVEFDPRLVAETNARLGFEACRQGSAEDLPAFDQPFDCITSFQVIEHLYRPEEMLRTLPARLRPDGLLILTTPNIDSWSRKVMGDRWHAFREDHVSMKNVPDWDRLIQAEGFQPLFVGSTFFTGIPLLNRLPLGVVNWALLLALGAARWHHGESFVGIYRRA